MLASHVVAFQIRLASHKLATPRLEFSNFWGHNDSAGTIPSRVLQFRRLLGWSGYHAPPSTCVLWMFPNAETDYCPPIWQTFFLLCNEVGVGKSTPTSIGRKLYSIMFNSYLCFFSPTILFLFTSLLLFFSSQTQSLYAN